MRWAALAILASGCNAVFGLEQTELVDAGPRDASADAMHSCPAIGTPLKVGGQFQQVVRQECQGYNVSTIAKIGVATCTEYMPTYNNFPYQGTLDGTMSKVDVGLTYTDSVRIYPEGDRVFVRGYDASNVYQASLYERTGDGWTQTKDAIPTGADTSSVSTFTTGPDRRVMLYGYGIPVTEYAQDAAGAWTTAGTYAVSDLGCSYIQAVSLSSDGLRMLVSCYRTDNNRNETRIAERASRSDKFGAPQPFEGAPTNLGFVMLSDDCSRIYFSALNAVFSADLTE